MTDRLLSVGDLRDQGYQLRKPPLALLVIDPSGEGEEFTSLGLYAREEWQLGEPWDKGFAVQTILRIRIIKRERRDQDFPDLVAKIVRVHNDLRRARANGEYTDHRIVVEQNAMGWPLVSTLRRKMWSHRVLGVTVVGGETDEIAGERGLIMPRMTALGYLRRDFGTQRIQRADQCPGWEQLQQEMRTFIWKGRRPEHADEATDDLVMNVCHAGWAAFRIIPPMVKAQKIGHTRNQPTFVQQSA